MQNRQVLFTAKLTSLFQPKINSAFHSGAQLHYLRLPLHVSSPETHTRTSPLAPHSSQHVSSYYRPCNQCNNFLSATNFSFCSTLLSLRSSDGVSHC